LKGWKDYPGRPDCSYAAKVEADKIANIKNPEIHWGTIDEREESMINRIKIKNGHELYIDGKQISPEKSQAVFNHSPDGFSFGYGGSGPAQAALAILLELTDKATAQAWYQNFKWAHVARWVKPDMEITIDIQEWIKEQK